MRATGITRPVDNLGRICLPKEMRDTLNINEGDRLEIFTDEEKIIVQKYKAGCEFCGDMDDLKQFNRRNICAKCRKEIGKVIN